RPALRRDGFTPETGPYRSTARPDKVARRAIAVRQGHGARGLARRPRGARERRLREPATGRRTALGPRPGGGARALGSRRRARAGCAAEARIPAAAAPPRRRARAGR